MRISDNESNGIERLTEYLIQVIFKSVWIGKIIYSPKGLVKRHVKDVLANNSSKSDV